MCLIQYDSVREKRIAWRTQFLIMSKLSCKQPLLLLLLLLHKNRFQLYFDDKIRIVIPKCQCECACECYVSLLFHGNAVTYAPILHSKALRQIRNTFNQIVNKYCEWQPHAHNQIPTKMYEFVICACLWENHAQTVYCFSFCLSKQNTFNLLFRPKKKKNSQFSWNLIKWNILSEMFKY